MTDRFHTQRTYTGTTAERGTVGAALGADGVGIWWRDADDGLWYRWNGTAWEQAASAPRVGWNLDVTTEVTMSWVDGTRTLTLTPTGASYEFWVDGQQFVKSAAESVTITDTEGQWYIYYNDSGVLTASQVAWDNLDTDKAFVAYLYWDATNNEAVFGSPGWELHPWAMDVSTHDWAHETIGTRYESGLTISENPADQLEVTTGVIHDEGIEVIITDGAGAGLWEQDLSPLQSYKLYKLGAGGDWRQGGAFGTTPIILDGGNDVQWNEFVAGAWQLTAAAANRYCAYWIVATSTHDEPIVILTGQGSPAAQIDTARDNNDISGMDFTDLGPEFKVLYRMMVRNIAGGVFYEISAFDDFRAASLVPSTGFVASAHGALSGLGSPADDHTQYLLNFENVLIVHPTGATRAGQYYNTITAALAGASSGDLILVMPGTYAEDITLVAGVTVMGLSRDDVIISGAGGATTVTVTAANAVLANLTVSTSVNVATAIGVGVGAGGTGFVLRDVDISVTNAGVTTFAFIITTAAIATLNDCKATGVGGTLGYGAYTATAGSTVDIVGGEYSGSTTADVARVANGTINVASAEVSIPSGTISFLTLTDETASPAQTITGLAIHAPDAPVAPAADRVVRLDSNKHLMMPTDGNVELNEGLLKVDGSADDNIWRIGEVVLDMDFTGTDFDTKAECQVFGLRFSDSDTPFPVQLLYTIASTWTHSAGNGWQPDPTGLNNQGAGLLYPLTRAGNWELEIGLNSPIQVANRRIYLNLGVYQEGGHVGFYAFAIKSTSGVPAVYYRAEMYTNDGDDTFTRRHLGVSINAAGSYIIRLRQKNAVIGVYDDQDNAWHDYGTLYGSAGQAIPQTHLFVQAREGTFFNGVIYLESLKLTYLL